MRMGRDKSALPYPAPTDLDCPAKTAPDWTAKAAKGQNFLTHATDRLQTLCKRVVVSGQSSVDHSFHVINDEVDHQGPIHGIVASLRFAKAESYDACFFTPVDMPNLTSDDLMRITDCWQESDTLTVAMSDRIEPLFAIYPVAVVEELEQCIERDNRSLMRWIKSTKHQTVAFSKTACRNINTPTDLKSNSQ